MHNPSRRRMVRKSTQMMGLAALSGATLTQTAHAAEVAAEQAAKKAKYGIEGLEAPELAIQYWIDKDGEPASFSIAENKGKWIFLKCFQSWCPGCHASGFPTLQAFSNEFHENPQVAIAGIQTVFEGFTTNSQDEVRNLQQKYELPITMGHDAGDPDGIHVPDTMLRYLTGGTPWLILIDPDGVVAFNDFTVNTTALIKFMYEQVG